MNKIFILSGPTSTGKTTLALDLCKKYNGEIISADSRQICRHMDIGTGKIPLTEKTNIVRGDDEWSVNGVNVWGYDLINPDDFFSSFEYANLALPKIKSVLEQHKNVFIVGGTGFYIDTITGRTKPSFVEPDFVLRKELEPLTAEDIVNKIKAIDESALGTVDIHNTPRLIRTLEKLLSKNIPAKKLSYVEDAKYYYLGLTSSRDTLFSRADRWAQDIWKNGLIEETQKLINLGYEKSPRLKGLIYKSVADYLNKKVDSGRALERIKFDLHGYIRRQQTYFNKNGLTNRFDISKESYKENIYNFIEDKMKNE